MSLFDYYEPVPQLSCPVCNTQLVEWQGKDGGCGLFVWRQGSRAPVEQRVDAEVALESAELEEKRLPEKFRIYSYDCACTYPVIALCSTTQGTWDECEVMTANKTGN